MQLSHISFYERKTGLEPATLSLEGWCSTKWATSACCLNPISCLIKPKHFRVGREGFEPSKLSQRIYSPSHLATLVSPLLNGPKTSADKELEPMEGFEPPTHWLQISSSGQLSYIGFFDQISTIALPLQKGIANVEKLNGNTNFREKYFQIEENRKGSPQEEPSNEFLDKILKTSNQAITRASG